MKQELFDMLLAKKKEIQAELQQVNVAIAAIQQASYGAAMPKPRKEITKRTMGVTDAIAKIYINSDGFSIPSSEILNQLKQIDKFANITSQAVHQACSYLMNHKFLIRVQMACYSLHPEFNQSKFYMDNYTEFNNKAIN